MPRNRKRKPPADPVEARITPHEAPAGVEACEARCGRCNGPVLIYTVNRAPIGALWEPLPIAVGEQFVFSNWGRRWDGAVWRSTAERIRRWQREREQAAIRLEQSRDAAERANAARRRDTARGRLRAGALHRTNHDTMKTSSVGMYPIVARDGYVLPTIMECDKCSVENVIGTNGS
jgi:hypothetical protein